MVADRASYDVFSSIFLSCLLLRFPNRYRFNFLPRLRTSESRVGLTDKHKI